MPFFISFVTALRLCHDSRFFFAISLIRVLPPRDFAALISSIRCQRDDIFIISLLFFAPPSVFAITRHHVRMIFHLRAFAMFIISLSLDADY